MNSHKGFVQDVCRDHAKSSYVTDKAILRIAEGLGRIAMALESLAPTPRAGDETERSGENG